MIYIGIIIILLLIILARIITPTALSIKDITPSKNEITFFDIKNVSRERINKIKKVDFASIYHDDNYKNIYIFLYVKEHGDISYSYVIGFEDELVQEFKKNIEVKVRVHQGRDCESLISKNNFIFKRYSI